MITVDGGVLQDIEPATTPARAARRKAIVEAIGGILRPTLEQFAIDSRLRVAHFLAQICHESDGFCTTVEYASGDAYEGRGSLGNTTRGDGRRFKGRGLIQLTGRANYTQYGKLLDLDLVNQPALAAEPKTALLIACEFWKQHGLNRWADQDDLITITRRINGGLNGLASRRVYLTKAKAALARLEAAQTTGTAPAGTPPILHRGNQNEEVGELQRRLRAAGFDVVIDGDLGPTTELAVKQFQKSKGLDPDGIVGPATWSALPEPAPAPTPLAAAPPAAGAAAGA